MLPIILLMITSKAQWSDLNRTTNAEAICNNAIFGNMQWPSDVEYIYFNLSSATNYLLFETCGRAADDWWSGCSCTIYMDFLDTDFNVIYEATRRDELNSGLYILKISGHCTDQTDELDHIHWFASISCDPTALIPRYVMGDYSGRELGSDEAESYCEVIYGTSLATIITEEDMAEARNVIILSGWSGYDRSRHVRTLGVWIGMYHDIFNGTKLQWIDGTPYNYTMLEYSWEWITDNNAMDPLHAYINLNSSSALDNDATIVISAYFDEPDKVNPLWLDGSFEPLCNRMLKSVYAVYKSYFNL